MKNQIRLRLHITLSDSNHQDVEIIEHLLRFRSGTGMLERAFEIKRLLNSAILAEKYPRTDGHLNRNATAISLVEIGQDITSTTKSTGVVVDSARGDKNVMGMIESLEKQTGLQIK